jgi:hypothetical protein
MGRKKEFTTSAFASLTGTAPATKPIVKTEVAETQTTKAADTEKIETKANSTKSAPKKAATAKSKKSNRSDIQNPNKRSVRAVHTPVTLYLNERNLNKLKEVAEEEAQKISWIIDELIYDYLVQHTEQ